MRDSATMANRKRGRREEEGRNATTEKERTIDDEVEEFFAIIRRIRATSRIVGSQGKINHCSSHNNLQTPSFQREDFAACYERPITTDMGEKRAASSTPSDRLSTVSKECENESGEEVEEESKRPKAVEENVIPAWLDLNLGFAYPHSFQVAGQGSKSV